MITARTENTSLYGDTSNRREHRRALPMSFQVDSAETTLIRRAALAGRTSCRAGRPQG